MTFLITAFEWLTAAVFFVAALAILALLLFILVDIVRQFFAGDWP